jgi:hypothetical protein
MQAMAIGAEGRSGAPFEREQAKKTWPSGSQFVFFREPALVAA